MSNSSGGRFTKLSFCSSAQAAMCLAWVLTIMISLKILLAGKVTHHAGNSCSAAAIVANIAVARAPRIMRAIAVLGTCQKPHIRVLGDVFSTGKTDDCSVTSFISCLLRHLFVRRYFKTNLQVDGGKPCPCTADVNSQQGDRAISAPE